MFDSNHVGKMIKDARIRKNMTQSALADAMCVSYQAVSNWERGNAMPDIGKLGDLCRILDLNLNELLGESEDVRLAEKVIDDSRGTGETYESGQESQPEDMQKPEEPAFSVASIIRMAPFLTPEQLTDILTAVKPQITEMSTLISLAPFVDGDVLEIIGENVIPKNISEVTALSPFVSDETNAHFIEKLTDFTDFDLDTGLLCALGPFLSDQKLNELAEKVTPKSYSEIVGAAPFLSDSALEGLIDRVPAENTNDLFKGITCLMPFISSDTLKRLLTKKMRIE